LRVLQTGATGFVGSRFIKLLKCAGHKIRIISRKPHLDYETVICDLGQEKIPLSALKSIDTVFHLAGFSHDLRDGSKLGSLYRAINVNSTVELAELAVKSAVKRFVFVSSTKAGGPPIIGKCTNEEDQNEPEEIYGKTKREAEQKLLEIGHKAGMFVTIIRPSLVYGAGAKGNLEMMFSGVRKGWFPPLPESGNRRSMIHVDDLVRAILLVANDERANGEIYIATDGDPHSSREVYEAICQAVGKKAPCWGVPKILFDGVALVSSQLQYKIGKLLGDECYSSEKLQALGFKAEKTLRNIND